MERFGRAVVKLRIPILIIGLLLLIPSVIGFAHTKVNYDMLYYLPDDIETMVGQDILTQQFGKGAFSLIVVEGMSDQDVASLKAQIEEVDNVDSVVWYDSVLDLSVPMEMLPDELYDAFNNGDATMMAVFFSTGTSDEKTMDAIERIRSLSDHQCFVSGMSAVVTDTKNLCEQEEPIYVAIAVLLSCLVLAITMDSFVLPFLFLASIGMAILYNLGSNYFMGEISYVTKALSAVLQLGVTMDYSIFLWHSFTEQMELCGRDDKEAMARAIAQTISSVVGSSLTTVAGFIALCFMSFTLGLDLGIVMAKGVIFGVISCVTILPALLMTFEKLTVKTLHRPFFPDLGRIGGWVTKHYKWFVALFVVLLIPALYGYNHTTLYYNLDQTLPKELDSIVANTELQEKFGMNSTHMLLVDADMSTPEMLDEIEAVGGVKFVLGFDSIVGSAVPEEMIPDDLLSILKSDEYQLVLIGSEYKVATDEVNAQIETINAIVKSYDPDGLLIGEAPCTKDLITITDQDFKVVSVISIAAVFIIIAFVLKSISIPVVLVSVIELAIFINMGIPYYTGTELPFIASIVIGTIQLGATVDYAILMTNRYKTERRDGKDKQAAVEIALTTSAKSITVSALGFFAATFGVGLYSDIDIISSLCSLMARGALISMCVVIFILPSMLMVFDKIICKTSLGFRKKEVSV